MDSTTPIHSRSSTTTPLRRRRLEKGSVDLVVTSPPYNVGIEYESNEDELAYADYLHFSKEWFSRCLDWLKPDGRFCLNIPLDINKGGQRHVGADLDEVGDRGRFPVPFHHRLERRQHLEADGMGFMDARVRAVCHRAGGADCRSL